jgi:ubiquinone/menaquinone biosynthesis C-methylase UbiE
MNRSDVGSVNRDNDYEHGHSDRELERLDRQARVVEPITRGFLRDAGIGLGMRVLDMGSGAGHVAFLAAELVGAAGEVVGVDRAPAAVAAARTRAEARSLRNVSFLEGEPGGMTFERPFDAVVGRYELMHQTDPTAALRALARHLRPGGVLVFHEPDLDGARSFPPAPTYDRCCRWIVETYRRLGAEPRMGGQAARGVRGRGPAGAVDVAGGDHRRRGGRPGAPEPVSRDCPQPAPRDGASGGSDGGRNRRRDLGRAGAQ